MPRLMLDRQVLIPPEYRERECLLVKYRLPALAHCYVLCHEPSPNREAAPRAELLAFFAAQAEQLAAAAVGDPQAFVLIHSGSSIRKRSNLHMHVFVVQRRWQKAWLYTVLGVKNLALAAYTKAQSLLSGQAPTPSIERTVSGKSETAAHVER